MYIDFNRNAWKEKHTKFEFQLNTQFVELLLLLLTFRIRPVIQTMYAAFQARIQNSRNFHAWMCARKFNSHTHTHIHECVKRAERMQQTLLLSRSHTNITVNRKGRKVWRQQKKILHFAIGAHARLRTYPLTFEFTARFVWNFQNTH